MMKANFAESDTGGNGMELAGWNNGCEQQPGQNWFEKGETALSESRNSEAAKCFGEALKADPFDAKAYRGLSNAYWAQGKTEDALNSLTRALELDPKDRETVLTCSRIFRSLGKEDFAKEVLQSYLVKNPHDEEILSKIEPAAMPADPDRSDIAEFFQRQGEIQFGRGNIPHAVACFEMAIEENPMLAEAYNSLAVIELESGKINEALEKFYKALDLKPEDTLILGNSARALAKASQIDAAIDVYREYLRRSPLDSESWTEFESLIRRTAASPWRPDSLSDEVAEIYLLTAEKLGKAGDLAGAIEAIDRSLKIKPPAPQSLYVLASLHFAIGQEDEAVKILDQALTMDPAHGPCSELIQSINRIREFRIGGN